MPDMPPAAASKWRMEDLTARLEEANDLIARLDQAAPLTPFSHDFVLFEELGHFIRRVRLRGLIPRKRAAT